jgi:hypothetical protein
MTVRFKIAGLAIHMLFRSLVQVSSGDGAVNRHEDPLMKVGAQTASISSGQPGTPAFSLAKSSVFVLPTAAVTCSLNFSIC